MADATASTATDSAMGAASDFAGAAAPAFDLPIEAVVALVVVVATVIFFILAKVIFGKQGGDSVLLLGACGAGKTSLFQMLRDGSTFSGTITSMEENEDRFAVEGKLVGVGGSLPAPKFAPCTQANRCPTHAGCISSRGKG